MHNWRWHGGSIISFISVTALNKIDKNYLVIKKNQVFGVLTQTFEFDISEVVLIQMFET